MLVEKKRERLRERERGGGGGGVGGSERKKIKNVYVDYKDVNIYVYRWFCNIYYKLYYFGWRFKVF